MAVTLPPIDDKFLLRTLQESSVTSLKNDPQIKSYIQSLPEAARNMVQAYITCREKGGTPDYQLIQMMHPQSNAARQEGFAGATISMSTTTVPSSGGATSQQSPVDPRVKAREDAIAKNKEIEAHNAPIQSQLGEVEKKLNHLTRLLNHIDAKGDGVLTWDEVRHLANNSGVPEVREAAMWLLSNRAVFDSLPKKRTLLGGEDNNLLKGGGLGADRHASAEFLAGLNAQANSLRAQLKTPVEVPALPTIATNASEGTNRPPGAEGPGGTPTNPGAQPKPGSSATESYDKIGPFSSNATTSEGRMADGLDYLQRGTMALQDDLVRASTETPPNQAKIAVIQQKLSQVQNAMTAVMQMMKQFQEMMSNMSKMYSEMAMSSIRNMR